MTITESVNNQDGENPPLCATDAKCLEAVRKLPHNYFRDAVDLRTFMSGQGAGGLSLQDRTLIVQQALLLIEQNYAHLPHKRAMYSIDPVQRLKLLLQSLQFLQSSSADNLPGVEEFHSEMLEIFASLRDRHTRYLLPAPYTTMSAFLPFMVEECFENQEEISEESLIGREPTYLVSHIADGLEYETFKPGVEVIYWNGAPIKQAILNLMRRDVGSNQEASRESAIQRLTNRTLKNGAAPDEYWVVVGYRLNKGPIEQIRFEWLVSATPLNFDPPMTPDTVAKFGLDSEQNATLRVRRALYKPGVTPPPSTDQEKAPDGEPRFLVSKLPDALEARSVEHSNALEARNLEHLKGLFGYMRIRRFNADHKIFVDEFIRLLSMLPQNGLIIDVRGNPGGNINSAEEILQTLTPHLIEGESAEFLNSPLNLAICNLNKAAGTAEDLSAWVDSMNLALMTGSAMSARFPLSSSEDCNRIGQKYFGPVILIVDALSYSAADIFAAGFQDHKIGTVLGTHSTTGAGGASKINHEDLMNVLAGGGCGYSKLPGGVGMSVALRRTLRVGKRAGLPLEDFGVKPKKHYLMTRNDLLYGNVDLIDKAIELLVALKYKRTQINVIRKLIPGTGYRINIKTRGITRIDVFLLDHPFNSFNLRHGKIEFNIPMPVSQTPTLEIRGFYKDKLVARYRDSFH